MDTKAVGVAGRAHRVCAGPCVDGTLHRMVGKALTVFVVGAAAGALCDQLHVQGGVIAYRDPQLLGQPWWILPQYGLAALLGYLAAVGFRTRLGPAGETVPVAAAWLLIAYVATAVVHGAPSWLAFVLLATWLVRCLIPRYRSTTIMIYCAGAAAVGITYEAILTWTGAFVYHQPDVLGLPYWLPGLYLNAAPLLPAVARAWGPTST